MEKESTFVGKHYLMKQAFDQEELHRREAVCTRDELPQCSASCPLHLDMRAVCAFVAKGNFSKGANLIRQTTPFLHLLSGNCHGECQKKCILAECGDGISVRSIEKACALYGGSGAVNRFMIPKKNKKAAVAGDDLFALACLWELGKKGYEVQWYTRCASLQEPLIAWNLTQEEASSDLTALTGFRISLKKQESISEESIMEWAKSVDVVCISPELDIRHFPTNGFTEKSQKKAAWILAEAKRVSLRADRFLQGVSADDVKEPETYESRLFVTKDRVKGSKAQADIEHINKDSAMAEAARCIQCQCLECIKGCAYLQHYKRNPKAAIREIYNNLSIVMGNHMANGMINACDQCGQCKAACPNGFDYPDVCQIARHIMVETKKMPPSTHEFALLDQQFSNGEAFLAKAQLGFTSCQYLFFPGCQATAVSPDTVEAAYRDLCGRLEGGVGLILGCCGAISKWAAREDIFAETLGRFLKVWQEFGKPVVICACPTCKKILDEHTEVLTVGIWNILMELGVNKVTDQVVAVHDACGARGDGDMQSQIREFVQALGCQVEEMPLTGDISPCCGFGGLVRYANPEVSGKKAELAVRRTEHKILTYCMACRDQFSRAGADTCHILELTYGIEPGQVPDISGRRANRLRLRERLLKDIWKEETQMDTKLPIIYGEGVEELMDDRMILKSDVEAVLKAYKESGEAVEDQEKGWLITNCRIGNVTFWVKFTQTEEAFMVHGAYSHRMTVE